MSSKTIFDDEYLSDKETATALGIAPRTLHRWRLDKRGPPFTPFGRRIMYRKQAVRDWALRAERAKP